MNTTSRFKCYTSFLRTLGRFDAVCTFSKLAVDRLCKEMSEHEYRYSWLSYIAAEHDLIINHVDEQIMPNRLAQMYILAVYSQLAEFLEAFLIEHPESNLWRRKEDEHFIDFTLRCIGALHNSECETDRETINYYRLVRNRFMHPDMKDICINKGKKMRKQGLTLQWSGCGESRERLRTGPKYTEGCRRTCFRRNTFGGTGRLFCHETL